MSSGYGVKDLNTSGRGFTCLANPATARWKAGGATIDWDTVDPVAGTNEVVTVTVDATGGTFTLTFGGQTTSAIAEAATAGAVELALEALSTIGNGNVNVSGSAGGPFTVEFVGDLANTNVGAITADATSLTGGASTVTIAVVTAGAATGDRTLDDGTIVAAGDKVIPCGTIMVRITASGKYGPADTTASDGRELVTAAVRGDAYILDNHVIESELGSDFKGNLFDAGAVFKDRVQMGGTNEPTESNVETMFPGITFVKS